MSRALKRDVERAYTSYCYWLNHKNPKTHQYDVEQIKLAREKWKKLKHALERVESKQL